MKHFIVLMLLLSAFVKTTFCQNAWIRIEPLPQEHIINDMVLIPGTTEIIASGRHATILRSHDGGLSWQVSLNPAGMCNLFHCGNMYFIDSLKGFVGGAGNTILMTEDGGYNWSVKHRLYDWCMSGEGQSEIEFANADTGFALFHPNYVIRTVDGGSNWEEVDLNGFASVDLALKDEDTGFISSTSYRQWFKTTDGGMTWNKEPFPESLTTGYIDDIYFTDSNTGFVYYDNVINKTIDGGLTWFEPEMEQTTASQGGFIKFFADGLHGMLVAGTPDYRTKLMLTEDGGDTWHEQLFPALEPEMYAAVYINNNDIVLGGLNGNLYVSNNGGYQWEQVNVRNIGLNVSQVVFTTNNTAYACSTCNEPGQFPDGCMYKSTDGGLTWWKLPVETPDRFRIWFSDDLNGYLISGYGGVVHKTTDGGMTWEALAGGPLMGEIREMKFSNPQHGIIAAYRSLLLTTNGGLEWTDVTTAEYADYRAIEFLPDGEIVVAGYSSSLYRSSDQGYTWTEYPTGAQDQINDLLFKNNDTAFLACNNNRLYRSVDGGFTFEQVNLQQEGKMHLNKIFFADASTGYIVGDGDTTNILKTVDGGTTWIAIPSMTTSALNDVYFSNSEEGFIFGKQGVCLMTTTGGVVHTKNITPASAEPLISIYPNPFSKTVTINFTKQPSLPARLLITDITGRNVISRDINANWPLILSTVNMQAGLYLFTVTENSGRKTTVKGIVRGEF